MFHLDVEISGGPCSGKSALAVAVAKALSKSKLYGVTLRDDSAGCPTSEGPVKVLVRTLERPVVAGELTYSGPEKRSFSQDELKAAFLRWELDIRTRGACFTTEEIRALPAGQVAENAASTLWGFLGN